MGSDHFATIGFIVNQCDTVTMSKFSSEISRQKRSHQVPAAENSGTVIALLSVFLALLALTCVMMSSYLILKNRG